MIVCSFYTPDYADHAARLAESCARFGYSYYIHELPDDMPWVEACALKGPFCANLLDDATEGLLWIDADAEILEPLPIVKWQGYDFAVHRRPERPPKLRFRSGTVWFRAPGAVPLLDEWAKRCEADPQTWDQQHLFEAWQGLGGKDAPRTLWLGRRYVQKFDEGDPNDAAIVHYQASRTKKAQPDGG